MERVGRENGILFSFSSKIGNSRDCHRLVLEFARPKGWQTEKLFIEKIFEWHFERDADITSHRDLAKMAMDAGIVQSEEEALAFLRGRKHTEDVDGLVAQAKENGVMHVPTFEIHGRRIEGAEDASVFYEALAGVKEDNRMVAGNDNAC